MENNLKSLFLEGRAWFDKVNGNTYHSVRIWANGKALGAVGFTYGYETAYEYTALEWLKKHNLVSQDLKTPWHIRNLGTDFYSVLTYTNKKELFKDDTATDRVQELQIREGQNGR